VLGVLKGGVGKRCGRGEGKASRAIVIAQEGKLSIKRENRGKYYKGEPKLSKQLGMLMSEGKPLNTRY